MLQADGTDVVGRCVSCQCLELVEETRTAHVLDFTEGVHVKSGLVICSITHSLTVAMNFQSNALLHPSGNGPVPDFSPAYVFGAISGCPVCS